MATPDNPLIYKKLIDVMRSIGAVDKSGTYDDKKGTRYNFRGVDAVVNAVAPAFREHGIICVPSILGVERETFDREMSGGRTGKHFRCVPLVQYTFYAEDGSNVSAIVEGESLDTSDKGTAKAMSVAYRVALLQSLNLPTDEPDPDTERPEVVSPPKQEDEAPDLAHSREALQEAIAGLTDADKELVKLEIRNQQVPSLKKPGATRAQLDGLADFLAGLAARSEPFEVSFKTELSHGYPIVESDRPAFEPVVASSAADDSGSARKTRDAIRKAEG